jgi:hypothetical protein
LATPKPLGSGLGVVGVGAVGAGVVVGGMVVVVVVVVVVDDSWAYPAVAGAGTSARDEARARAWPCIGRRGRCWARDHRTVEESAQYARRRCPNDLLGTN